MYGLANHYDWNAIWRSASTTFSLTDRGIWIVVDRIPRARVQLRTLHVVFALFYTMVAMSEDSMFCSWNSYIYLNTREIGTLFVEANYPTSNLRNNSTDVDFNGAPSIAAVNSTVDSTTLGITINIEGLTITYNYVGDRINSKDLFIAVLNGMAEAAKAGAQSSCESLRAASLDSNIVFSITKSPTSPQPLTYKVVTLVMRLITLDMALEQRRFAEISFVFRWRKEQIGHGLVRKRPPQPTPPQSTSQGSETLPTVAAS